MLNHKYVFYHIMLTYISFYRLLLIWNNCASIFTAEQVL
jgi:hypothetical protein